ncbi:SDR family oxidoreductase [Aurantimicrobium minutum]|uniref:SDR family oxidoreductase n=1 Tax=Aurantimicrobium minutum TaxID=708131 RepID=UPI002475C795|nr:SDR family oxidoreductase [Aurantimicrobium minutum]MDH6255414.1 3-oxoacyl-[acyl-carrier protein] reductase [Aurantimicrobium minutum]
MIIVTGASRGLGLEISNRLTQNGIEVLGISRNPINSNFLMKQIDVTSHTELRKLAAELRAQDIKVTALINAAGIASMNLALMTTPEKVSQVIQTNLQGTIYSCQTIAPLLIRSGGGSIINFSTIAVNLGLQGEAVYAASKAGVEAFSRVFARELSSHNVKVNCIAPGPIDTSLLSGVSSSQIGRIIERQIIQKKFEPKDIADLVELLLDPKANSITGQLINVGGV